MEPITWGFIVAAALSGVIGNKADVVVNQAFGKGFKAILNRLKQGDEPVNQELQKAVNRSFLLAQQSIVLNCLEELTGGRKYRGVYDCLPQYRGDVKWLEQKLKQLKAELHQLETAEFVAVSVTSFAEIELLLTPDGALVGNSIQTVRDKLIDAVNQGAIVPYYQDKVVQAGGGLFERMCAFFAAEMSNNPIVSNIVQGQLLTQINGNLQEIQAQQLTVRDLENSLRDLAGNVPQDIAEIKGLLQRIDQQLVMSSPPPVPLQFQSLIDDKTEGFVGREFVFNAIEAFLQEQPNGYFIIEADPGVGKSAILAEYVRRTGCVAHFNVRSQGINRAEEFLKSICIQLIERYQLPYEVPLHPDNTRDGNFLARLLNEISTKCRDVADNACTVIAVDALDEVDLDSQAKGANVLYLPASLPNGVYFIVTKRPISLPFVVNKSHVFNVMDYQAESLDDVQVYIRQRTHQSPLLQEWIASRELTIEEFVIRLGEKSDRNFMYLRYVLPGIEHGEYNDLSIENLPKGLEQYYYQHWERMGMTAKPLPRTKIKIVYVLSEALKPISCELISQFVNEDEFTVQEVLEEWEQFLREQEIEGQIRYSIYHASFQDFLHRREIVKKAGVTIQGINALIADNLAAELGL
ncbi:MAG TPA: hypothetical protein DCY91_26555 [Cyanobacteria bacterium UBA11370]|nr:hypothetical protein [Cyanobacteria bacterium UBA11370]